VTGPNEYSMAHSSVIYLMGKDGNSSAVENGRRSRWRRDRKADGGVRASGFTRRWTAFGDPVRRDPL